VDEIHKAAGSLKDFHVGIFGSWICPRCFHDSDESGIFGASSRKRRTRPDLFAE
jgi:hypothetical protein